MPKPGLLLLRVFRVLENFSASKFAAVLMAAGEFAAVLMAHILIPVPKPG